MSAKSSTRRGPRLDGVFIAPGDSLQWSKAQWGDALAAIAAAGMDAVILQWCAANGRALYPTESRGPMPAMGVEDVVGTLLAAAERAGVGVILGLDASRRLADVHYDPSEAQIRRNGQVVMELLVRYGGSAALGGFYLPQEWSSAPEFGGEEEIIKQTGLLCQRLRPDLSVCTSARIPKLWVRGHGWELFETDPEARAQQRETYDVWAHWWKGLAEEARLGAVLVRDDAGSRRCAPEQAQEAYAAMRREFAGADCELWAQVGLYEVAHRPDDADPPGLHCADIARLRGQLRSAARHCDRLFGFSFEHMNPARGGERARLHEDYRKYLGAPGRVRIASRRRGRTADTRDPLLEKAVAVERIIEQRHLLEGQIMTVVDYRRGLDDRRNQWQEDADWLTGLYIGAESLRFAATGDPDARARARRSFEALCMLSTISGVPGVVARSYRRTLTGGLGSGRKRWHKVDGQDLWWATDISRDQLSGHFFGLAAYYDLVADESERKLTRRLVSEIAGSILDHRLQAVDWDGEYTIHGNFWVAPFQALATLKLAHHITRERRFQQAYEQYINPHFFLGHAIIQAAHILDPFFQHYQYDSPAYHLLQYETNPDLLRHLLRALDLLYADTRDLGNVYLCFVYQTYRPESDAARRGEAELLEFEPERLYVPRWRRHAQAYLRRHGEHLPEPLRETLRCCLEPEQAPPDQVASFIPMKLRPPMEFNWQYYAGIQTRGRAGGRPHGPYVGYAGVDYLLAYWMGRYHGFLR